MGQFRWCLIVGGWDYYGWKKQFNGCNCCFYVSITCHDTKEILCIRFLHDFSPWILTHFWKKLAKKDCELQVRSGFRHQRALSCSSTRSYCHAPPLPQSCARGKPLRIHVVMIQTFRVRCEIMANLGVSPRKNSPSLVNT